LWPMRPARRSSKPGVAAQGEGGLSSGELHPRVVTPSSRCHSILALPLRPHTATNWASGHSGLGSADGLDSCRHESSCCLPLDKKVSPPP
jgi:hypothetical protein